MMGKHACNIWEMPNALNNRSSPPPPSLSWLRAPSVFFLSIPTNLQTNYHLVHVAFIHLGGGVNTLQTNTKMPIITGCSSVGSLEPNLVLMKISY